MHQSITDSSTTPSPPPPVTPSSSNSCRSYSFLSSGIPHVDSTPIRNYFARFSDSSSSFSISPQKKRAANRSHALQTKATPRTLWKRSDQTIPFPPSKSRHKLLSPFSFPAPPTTTKHRTRRQIEIDVTKFDAFYHPLTETIEQRPDLNVFSDSYFEKTKKFYDEQPFLDPVLHSKMRDDLFKLLCDLNDQNSDHHDAHYADSEDADYVKVGRVHDDHSMIGMNHSALSMHSNDLNDDAKDAIDALDTFGDHGITKMLDSFSDIDRDEDDDVNQSPMDRAQRLIECLRSDGKSKSKSKRQRPSSFERTCGGMVFLSGVLEYIVSVLVDSAGCIAKANHSVLIDQRHSASIRSQMDENRLMVTQYDRDVFEHDINRDLIVIRPIHIRHAIHDDEGLFWLQQAIQTVHLDEDEDANGVEQEIGNGVGNGISNGIGNGVGNGVVQNGFGGGGLRSEDIQDALDKDCVSHICSFFCGDLPMLSSLARVNTTFYAMTSSNLLWRPIAIRCFLFNPDIVVEIDRDESDSGESGEETASEMVFDFRSYIALRDHIKLSVLRERWMKQDLQSEDGKFEIYVRINPVYTALHCTLHQLLYVDSDGDGDGNGDGDGEGDGLGVIDQETYDVFRALLELFGNRRDFVTVSQIVNHIKCFTAKEMQHRFGRVFEGKLTASAKRELNKVIEIEYENHEDVDEVLFLEIPLSESCFDRESDDWKRNCLWLGRHIAVFSEIPKSWRNRKRLY